MATPRTTSACDHPVPEMRAWLTGSMVNCPKEPPVLATVSAMVRFSGGASRPTAPRTTEKLVPLMPSPTRRPALTSRELPEVAPAINTSPPA
jgi:hypothetical protein